MADPKPEKPKPMSKTEVLAKLSEATELSKKQVESVLTALEELIKQELGKKGPGVFQIHGLVKFELIKKPATKATERENPFKKGEMMKVAAKPASVKVKAVILKGLKEIGK